MEPTVQISYAKYAHEYFQHQSISETPDISSRTVFCSQSFL